ncbi:hypothetical protein E0H65_08090 [Rhizobium leguminosarum bv. viciae]|nr:hypothetical protein E0H65_08090 [Rhizobium leguminosarum bv. viciae]
MHQFDRVLVRRITPPGGLRRTPGSAFGIRHEDGVSERLDKNFFVVPVANKDFGIPIVVEVVLFETLTKDDVCRL